MAGPDGYLEGDYLMGKVTSTVTISKELLEDPRYDVLAIIEARLRERLPLRLAEVLAKECEEDILMIYGDPTAPKPRGLIVATEAT